MPVKADVSVIIISNRDVEQVWETLVSVTEQVGADQVELLVVTDGWPSDVLQGMSSDGLSVRILSNPTPGHSNRGRVHGAEMAEGQFLIFLDDDVAFQDANQLSRLSQELRALKSNSVLRGTYRNQAFGLWAGIYSNQQLGFIEQHHFVVAGAVGLRRDTYEVLRPFDSDVSYGGADLRLNSQIRKHDFAMVESAHFEVLHQHRFGFDELSNKAFRQGRALRNPKARWDAYVFTDLQFSWRSFRGLEFFYRFAFCLGESSSDALTFECFKRHRALYRRYALRCWWMLRFRISERGHRNSVVSHVRKLENRILQAEKAMRSRQHGPSIEL